MRNKQTVLLVDDEQPILFTANLMIRSTGVAEVVTLDDSRKVLPLLSEQEISAIVLDLSMPFMSGIVLIDEIGREHPDIPLIVMTGANNLDTAVQCMKAGAFDYLVKPVESERFLACIARALEVRALKEEMLSLKQHLLEGRVEHAAAFSKIVTRQQGAAVDIPISRSRRRICAARSDHRRDRRGQGIVCAGGARFERPDRTVHRDQYCRPR